MQIMKNKSLIAVISAVVLILIVLIIAISTSKNKKYDYYYEFVYDDNLITQTVKVYDSNNKIQSNYELYYKDKLITITTGDSAVLSIAKADLKDHQTLKLIFGDDESGKEYSVGYKR